MSKDYYEILGTVKGASKEEIKKAFRVLAHKHHPDKAGGDEAKFKEINEAYQVLSDDKKRAQYDQFGPGFDQAGAGGFGGFKGGQGGFQSNINMEDLSDMFGDVFGFGGGRGGSRTHARARGKDIHVRMHISFHEAAFGVEREIELFKPMECDPCSATGIAPGSKMKTCVKCSGHGQVTHTQRTILGNFATRTTCVECQGIGNIPEKICKDCSGGGVVKKTNQMKIKVPAGIDDGETIRLSGQGEAGGNRAGHGDLYLKVRVKDHACLSREGFNVFSDVQLSFSEAALGSVKKIETLDGEVDLKVPSGVQSGEDIRLKGRGVTRLGTSGRGDHYIKVVVQTPKHPSRKAKKLLQELGEEGV